MAEQPTLIDIDPQQIWVSPAEFAKEIKVSAEAVNKAIKNDRFNQYALKKEKNKSGTKTKYKINISEGKRQWDLNRAKSGGSSDNVINGYKQQEAQARAGMAQLDYQEKSGKLVRVSEVKKHYSRKASTIRDAFLNEPSRLAQELVALGSDIDAIENRLKERFTEILKELADDGLRKDAS